MAPLCLVQIVANRAEVTVRTEVTEGECQRHDTGNLCGVSCFKSPWGYSGKTEHGSVSPEADGDLGVEGSSGFGRTFREAVLQRHSGAPFASPDTGRQSRGIHHDQMQRNDWRLLGRPAMGSCPGCSLREGPTFYHFCSSSLRAALPRSPIRRGRPRLWART